MPPKNGLVVLQWYLEVQPVLFNYNLTIVGDFRQCLPVIPRASRAQIVASTISNAIFWKDVVLLKLNINMRLLSQAGQMDPERLQHAQSFANWLLEIGNGDVNSTSSNEITLPDRMTSTHLMLLEKLIDFQQISVFPIHRNRSDT